ncbi:MAG: 2-amino-4-hydroxy-6-hydroxymethyldihydropteridine diphosphokinase [Planctomycetes bacterium]|nr:2-amino-4-hydroxy-6-hydroxymethyldihydropteridine diphosphokinase [Planctomycetota bacterium]
MALAHLGLGSNLGDRRAVIEAALADLARAPEVAAIRAVSTLHETEPVGGPPGQPRFLNGAAAVEVKGDVTPEQFLALLLEVERRHGRARGVKDGPRTIDLDLLLWEDRVIHTPRLTVPHPRMAQRRFVLAPLAEIAPEAVHPALGRTVRYLLDGLAARKQGLQSK